MCGFLSEWASKVLIRKKNKRNENKIVFTQLWWDCEGRLCEEWLCVTRIGKTHFICKNSCEYSDITQERKPFTRYLLLRYEAILRIEYCCEVWWHSHIMIRMCWIWNNSTFCQFCFKSLRSVLSSLHSYPWLFMGRYWFLFLPVF